MPASITSSMDGDNANAAFQVFLRLRPQLDEHNANATSIENRFLSTCPPTEPDSPATKVTVHPPANQNRFRAIETFAFTEVFDESTDQVKIFSKTVLPLVETVLRDGRDALLATLGATGSGKTHTILGNKNLRGMTQLALDTLFRSLSSYSSYLDTNNMMREDKTEANLISYYEFHSKNTNADFAPTPPMLPSIDSKIIPTIKKPDFDQFGIVMSIYEVYNDRIFDLLAPQTVARRAALAFKACRGQPDRKVVAKLRKVHVGTFRQALEVLEAGQHARRNGETGSNDRSSRSHCFVEIAVHKISGRDEEHWQETTLTIVDLAGSERVRNARTAGDRLAEGGYINKSLMCLGQCLQLSTANSEDSSSTKPAMIPYRQSKLTELLFTNSYNAHRMPQLATMIITADPTGDFNTTAQILRYSALARSMTIPRAPLETSRQISNNSFISAVSSLDRSSSPTGHQSDNSLNEVIANLRAQLRAAEERWQQAEERCLEVEQIVRQEIASEMEERVKLMERRLMAKMEEEQEYQEEHMDRKLEILKKTMAAKNGSSVSSAEFETYTRDLEDENELLREQVRLLNKRVATDHLTPIKKRSKKV